MGKNLFHASDQLSESNTEQLVLYSTDLSPCVRRVRISLLEKGLDFDVVDVDLANMQQRSPDYLKLNPNGFVPTLSHRGHLVFESGVINEYLEEQFPEKPLMPADPYERAQVRMWVAAEGSMAKIFRAVMYQRLMGPIHHLSRSHDEALAIARRATDDSQDLAWESRVWNLRVLNPQQEAAEAEKLYLWLDNVEQALRGQEFLVGDKYSQADISMYPRIAMYDYLGVGLDSERYPEVLRWMKKLEGRASFEASMTPAAKKLRAMATSEIMNQVRAALAKPAASRAIIERAKLWGVGKLLRRVTGVNELLKETTSVTSLYMPPAQSSAEPRLLSLSGNELELSSSSHTYLLYGDELSPYTHRVATLLKTFGVSHTLRAVDSRTGETLDPELLQFNPQQELPVLMHGDRAIAGADVIAEYLSQIYQPSNTLWYPKNSQQGSLLRMWLALEAGSHKEFTPLWKKYSCRTGDDVYFIANEALSLSRILNQLGILEIALLKTPYLCGELKCYADITWHTRLNVMMDVPGFSLEKFPAIENWQARMKDIAR